MDVAQYNERVMGPAHVENVAELACRTAISYRCVAHVTIPTDVQDMEVKRGERSKRNVPHHVSNLPATSPREPNEEDILRAADILNSGKKIAILAGQGALHATDELEQ